MSTDTDSGVATTEEFAQTSVTFKVHQGANPPNPKLFSSLIIFSVYP